MVDCECEHSWLHRSPPEHKFSPVDSGFELNSPCVEDDAVAILASGDELIWLVQSSENLTLLVLLGRTFSCRLKDDVVTNEGMLI